MKINRNLKNVLINRHYLVTDTFINIEASKYFNAYLLSNFGIVVDQPELLTKEHVQQISDYFHLTIPNSFYSNPQDLKYFTKEELLVEQIISYFAYGSDLGRIEVFKNDLPEYVIGDELKLRTFYIINEEKAVDILSEIMTAYCSYTRPFSNDELAEFTLLFEKGFYNNTEICCKDNIFSLLPVDATFARFLDKKDIVKLSIDKFGDRPSFNSSSLLQSSTYLESKFVEIAVYLPYVKSCPLSKKQAKYFNKIVSLCKLNMPKETNRNSPDKQALKLITEGKVLDAANVYAKSGSMLERRIKFLLSRANPLEAVEILKLLPSNNPLALYQLMSTLTMDNGDPRTFTFYRNKMVKVHNETEYETTYRKSKLNDATRKLLVDTCLTKIKDHYSNLPKLGKVYIADNFYKIGLPTNTSAGGKGIDVLPTGSRLPCTGSKIRTFVHWKNAFDIDSSLIVVDDENHLSVEGWFSYGNKRFGNDILFSGDITGRNGAEFFDIDLDALASKGYKYVIQTFHGYCSILNEGEIYAGYQNKENLETKVWDPKNIEMQFKVYGDSRACVAFAIDIQKREVVILNQIIDDDNRVVQPKGFKTIEKYLQPEYLSLNIGLIAECRGELVDDPAQADIVFDDTFVPAIVADDTEVKKQEVIRSYELEKLVAFINK